MNSVYVFAKRSRSNMRDESGDFVNRQSEVGLGSHCVTVALGPFALGSSFHTPSDEMVSLLSILKKMYT